MACSMNYLGTVGMYAVSLSFKKSPMDIIGLGLTYDFKIKAAVSYYLATKQTMNGSEGIYLCTIQKNFKQLKTFKGSYIPVSHYDNRMEVMEMVKVLSCQVKSRH